MLFFKLYNWLKYKTLPSSFLFKNRLFIERDSKHRRVINNFGLTFRNSKWSSYANNNVNQDFKNNYFKFFLGLFTFFFFSYLIIFLNFTNNFFFNSISFFLWFTVDTFDYYLSFFIWSLLSFVSISLSKIYLFVEKNNSEVTNDNLKVFKKFNSHDKIFSNHDIFLSKNDLNWFLYSWLKSNDNNYSSSSIELLFDSNVSKNIWNNNYNFFIDLYQTVFFLNLNNKSFYYYKSLFDKSANLEFFKLFNFFDNNKILNNYFTLLSSFYYKNSFKPNSVYSTFNNNKWNLESLSLETFKNNFLNDKKKGYFFLTNFSFFDLSRTLDKSNNFFFLKNLLIKDSIKHAVEFSKWNRWLYRYSLLHRKSVKYANKLTFTKKLMKGGFYNSSIFKKNIWNSVYFNSKNLHSSQMTTFFDSYFNDFLSFDDKNFSKKFNQDSFLLKDKNNFLFFQFFENSYFWHLKRMFLFNSLNTNFSFLKTSFKSKENNDFFINSFNNQFLNTFYFNFFMKNRRIFLQPLDLYSFNTNLDLSLDHSNFSNTSIENIFFNSPDVDLFNKDDLSILNIVSSNPEFHEVQLFDSFNIIDYFILDYDWYTKFKKTNFFYIIFFNQISISRANFFCFKDISYFDFYTK